MPDSSLRFHKLNRGTTFEWASCFWWVEAMAG